MGCGGGHGDGDGGIRLNRERKWRQKILSKILFEKLHFWAPIRENSFDKIFDKIEAIRFFGSFCGH